MSNSPSAKAVFNRYEKIMIALGLTLLVFFIGYGLGRSTSQPDESNFVYAEVVGGDMSVVGKKIYGRDVLPEIQESLLDLEREKYRLKRAATEKKLSTLLNPKPAPETSDLEGLAEFAKERGIDVGKLTERQRRDLEGNFRILKSQLVHKEETQKALAAGNIQWGIVPLYRRQPVEVASGSMTPLVVGNGDHRVVVFANYHCPVCGGLWSKLDELVERSKGKTSVYLRYFVQEGDALIVRQTALAGYCLDEQKRLSDFHRAMREHAPSDEAELLKRVAEIPEVVQSRFEKCWQNRMTEIKLERDLKDGKALEIPEQAIAVVNGVPVPAQESLAEYLILIRQ